MPRSGSSGSTIATAAVAVGRPRVWGRPMSAISRMMALSRRVMKRQGCSLRLLPDQRATSVMASSSALVTFLLVNARAWRTRMSGSTSSSGAGPEAALALLALEAALSGGSGLGLGGGLGGHGSSFRERGQGQARVLWLRGT